MPEQEPRILVYYPETTSELIQLYRRKPSARICGGGTLLFSSGRSDGIGDIISLQNIEELNRVSRTDRYIELGAATTLTQIADIGTPYIPQALLSAIDSVGPLWVRNLATIGGNVCTPAPVLTLVPVLQLLEARLELRQQGHSRWLPIGRFHPLEGGTALKESEVLTRIRLPIATWNVQAFRKFGRETDPKPESLTFCGVARTGKGVLQDFRFVFSTGGSLVVRNRELEAEIIGRKLPLAARDFEALFGGMDDLFAEASLAGVQLYRARNLLRWFVRAIAESASA
jgi:CO/xanthine dehydrogenase FAD-binding subunit